MDLTRHIRALFVTATLGFVLVAGLSACGDDDDTAGGAGTGQEAPGNGIDRAFVADMIPHHEAAVEMAKVADQRAKSAFVKGLAKDITRTQNEEIATMQAIAAKLDEAGVKPQSLGLSDSQMGMDHDVAMLQDADPFDREFIDMMIPHHQGAIRMARVQLAKGSSAEVKKLSQQIIAAQAREIEAMNKHRSEEFGAVSPAGAVPEAGEQKDATTGHEGTEHE